MKAEIVAKIAVWFIIFVALLTLGHSTTKCRNITIEDGKYRVRIGGHSFGRYNTLEEAQEVVRRERKNIFPLSSELDNKITI